jgi:N-acylethanolamine-hydrolysing acid amidase
VASNAFTRVGIAVMRLVTVLALVGTLVASASALQKAPAWTLDLDAPPAQRFVSAVTAVVEAHGWSNTIGAVVTFYQTIMDVAVDIAGPTLGDILQQRFPERYGELQGIAAGCAKVGHPELNMTNLVIFPFFYELSHVNFEAEPNLTPKQRAALAAFKGQFARACTGILSLPVDKSLPILHGRNMDENPAAGRNCTLNITVVRGGQVLYHIFDWTWLTGGAYTASRVGGVTLEENWNTDTSASVSHTHKLLGTPATGPVALLFPNIQESTMSFSAATEFLMNVSLASPAYIIMSGPGRVGHVLTLQVDKTANVRLTLNDSSPVPFLVQTNYDHWLPDPPTDPRRTAAERALSLVGPARSGTDLGVWMALSTYPVHNPSTKFSVLMTVEQFPEGYVREAMVPQP